MLPTLIESALRSLAIAIVVWLAIAALRIRNPYVQHTSWLVVTIAALSMPLLMTLGTIGLPAASISVDWNAAQMTVVNAETIGSQNTLTGIYLLVCGALLARWMIGLVQTWRINHNAQRVNESRFQGNDVRSTPAIRSPVTFASTILLPSDWASWSDAKLDAVIAHESTHVRHLDSYVQLFAQLHRAIFWFSPLAWWLPKRLSELSEMMSDDAAVECVIDRAEYASALLEFARDAHQLPSKIGSAAIDMARPSTVSARIERILNEATPFASIGRLARLGIAICLVPLVAVAANGAPQTIGPQNSPSVAKSNSKLAPNSKSILVLPKVDPTLGLSSPAYPADEKLSEHSGTVYLNVLVGSNGSILEIQVMRSSGYSALDQAAVNEAANWRLVAGTENGVPTNMWATIPIVFKLDNDALPAGHPESNSSPTATAPTT
jgi:TonB family protein